MKSPARHISAALALAIVLLAAAPRARAQAPDPAAKPPKAKKADTCKPMKGRFVLTLKPEAELKDFVEWITTITCKRFIYPVNLSGRSTKITIYSTAAVNADESWKLFLTSLAQMQLTVVPNGNGYYKLVESMRAKDEMPPIFKSAKSVPNSDQVVTAVFRLEHVAPEDISSLLASLKSREGIITPFAQSNMLIITDYGSSLRRLARIVQEIDVPAGNQKLYVVKIPSKASASDIAAKLNEIFAPAQSGRGQSGGGRRVTRTDTSTAGGTIEIDASDISVSKILPDDRTNSIIIVASERSYRRILALIKRLLDSIEEQGQGKIHVYRLENSDAEPLANTLNQIVSGSGGTPTRGQQQNTQGASTFEGAVKVSPHKETNSLIVVSSLSDFLQLRDVIRSLDLPRRQVFVEATILEVSLDKSRKVGVSFHGGGKIDIGGESSLGLAGVQHPELSSILLNPISLMGLAAGIRGPEIAGAEELLGIPGVSIPSFGVIFQALQSNNDVNVLSSPHILTTDNEKAEISVGQNVPFATSLIGTGGSATNSLFPIPPQIQRQDIALKLSLTPHVNDSDFVRLELEQEISDIASENFNNTGQPSTNKRTVKTMVVVRDQQSVVIGGLMTDRESIIVSKVPLLGDIPILGYFFKQRRRTVQKANLLIFLTPYVIKNQGDLRRIFERKLRERREFIETYTQFKDREFEANIDYKRKRGLIEEINKAVQQSEEEDRLLKEAERSSKDSLHGGAVELEVSGDLGDDDGGEGDGGEGDEGNETTPAPAPGGAPR